MWNDSQPGWSVCVCVGAQKRVVHLVQSSKSDTQTIERQIVILVFKTSSEMHVYAACGCGWHLIIFFVCFYDTLLVHP